MTRLISAMAACWLSILTLPARAAIPDPALFVTPLNLHPAWDTSQLTGKPPVPALPQIVHPGTGADTPRDPRQIPVVKSPETGAENPETAAGKSGTGFFIGADGTLLTAAHVVADCGRVQIVSKYVARMWVSPVAVDPARDIALLRAVDFHPPAIARVAPSGPVTAKLLVLGFPAAAGMIDTQEAWGEIQNQKFPADVGPLGNPRELLWLRAPSVTHGYSGGPIFDPRLGAVVGLVKGEVEAGYLRLVRAMPTSGVMIGPGSGDIAAFLREQARYTPVSPVSAPGADGIDALRRATVHVLCWRGSAQ